MIKYNKKIVFLNHLATYRAKFAPQNVSHFRLNNPIDKLAGSNMVVPYHLMGRKFPLVSMEGGVTKSSKCRKRSKDNHRHEQNFQQQ